MIGLAGCPQNALQNWFQANRTFFQRLQVIVFAKRLPFQSIKWFSLQIDLAFGASETRNVINLIHGRAAAALAQDAFATFKATSCQTHKKQMVLVLTRYKVN